MKVEKILVVGLGLIGGSLSLAIKEKKICKQVLGYDINPETREIAIKNKIVDICHENFIELIDCANLIILSVPPKDLKKVFLQLKQANVSCPVTDTASVKEILIAVAEDVFGEVPQWLIPAHPLAGGTMSGLEYVDKHLFSEARVVITPHHNSDTKLLTQITEFWQSLGSITIEMDAATHDLLIASASHLPHIVVAGLAGYIGSLKKSSEVLLLGASGLRDTLRIAAANPILWQDIYFTNNKALLHELEGFINYLEDLKIDLKNSNKTSFLHKLERASETQKKFTELQGKKR